MNPLAIICLIIGTLIIISRGPLIFAPGPTLKLYRKLLDKNSKIRIMGLVFLPLSIGMILTARDHPHSGAVIMMGLGYFFTFVFVVFLVIFTGVYKLIANAFLDAMDNVMLRSLGVFSIGLGILFFYLGLAVFK